MAKAQKRREGAFGGELRIRNYSDWGNSPRDQKASLPQAENTLKRGKKPVRTEIYLSKRRVTGAHLGTARKWLEGAGACTYEVGTVRKARTASGYGNEEDPPANTRHCGSGLASRGPRRGIRNFPSTVLEDRLWAEQSRSGVKSAKDRGK